MTARQRPEALAPAAGKVHKAGDQHSPHEEPYDATRDPRTGRPPLPSEAERLNQERELQQARNAQLSEGEEAEWDDDDEIDVTLENELENEDDAFVNTLVDEQEPGRMVSPRDDEEDEETGSR